jgi:hypothetical protein
MTYEKKPQKKGQLTTRRIMDKKGGLEFRKGCYSANKMSCKHSFGPSCGSSAKQSSVGTHLAHHVAQIHCCCTGEAQEDKSKS